MDYTKHDINHHLDVDNGTNDLGDYSAKSGSRGCVPPEGRRACESADLAEHVCWLGRRLAERCCLRLLRESLPHLRLPAGLCFSALLDEHLLLHYYCTATALLLLLAAAARCRCLVVGLLVYTLDTLETLVSCLLSGF